VLVGRWVLAALLQNPYPLAAFGLDGTLPAVCDPECDQWDKVAVLRSENFIGLRVPSVSHHPRGSFV